MIELHKLISAKGSRRKRKIRGRGDSSGRGSYSGRGRKGQRARSGGKRGLKYLGIRRMVLATPKHGGFLSIYKKPAIVNVALLEKLYQAGDRVTPTNLLEKGIVDKVQYGVKILSSGTLTKKLTIEGCLMSCTAKEKIEKAGGTIL
mgnify:FL=1